MTLPPRIRDRAAERTKKANRTGRWKSTAHRNFVREHACCVPNCDGRPIEVSHLDNGTDKGMGRKASDWFTMSLCRSHHDERHQIGEDTFQAKYGLDFHAIAKAFAERSPKAAEIRKARDA